MINVYVVHGGSGVWLQLKDLPRRGDFVSTVESIPGKWQVDQVEWDLSTGVPTIYLTERGR